MKRIIVSTISFLLLCSTAAVMGQKKIKIPRIEGEYVHIYKPKGDVFPGPGGKELVAGKFYEDWVPNDHCFVRSKQGIWHVYGITHPITSVNEIHEGEYLSFHAVAPPGTFKHSLKKYAWKEEPKLFTPAQRPGDRPEFHSPTPLKKDGMDYLIWGPYTPLRYASSTDLYHWELKGTMKNTPDNRDPNVLFYDGTYYLIACGNDVVNMSTSKDLINWTPQKPILEGKAGASFESPFLVRYNNTFYLFACLWDSSKWDGKDVSPAYQHVTNVYQSDNIFSFDKEPITQLNAHAGEIIQDEANNWYISSAEWPYRGISVASLVWD